MQLHQIFAKPADRPIEGVIKADDAASLPLELEEYVFTQEVQKRLDGFLAAYNDYQGANGVWISGFFGSGKSHLLKMLAVLLENRQVGGKPALDYFEGKCEGDRLLAANLKKAVALPSRSILFNIDQKATVISKSQTDALLSVFVQVFNEMRGYYGKQGHVARFERDLDSRGQYDAFRAAYGEIAGKAWEKGREQFILEVGNIDRAYTQITGVDSSGILAQYKQTYEVSIEDFANEVADYVQRQERGFRLNFFVDEVGQYIAGSIKLMTNLQTIAESLATKCQGQAWIMVTAQEDMDTVLGSKGKQQSNDFSKIQDRFKNRMKLTSQNVAEVIQTRLLMKTAASAADLKALYASHQNNFKTLFEFTDGSKTFRMFKDGADFTQTYPFIPYQFELFKTTIEQLSQHSAFEGKHSSVGERSMLGVFQAVVIHLQGRELGELATFDLMFEGIRTTLKSMIQAAILSAERNLGDDFAVRVLKALFLVKYVKEFKATLRNLCVLMRESFTQNPADLEERVQGALNRLERESYIQRNGEFYEYLTDEEKDIEKEIKNIEVDAKRILNKVNELVFQGKLISKKIRYSNDQDYGFTTIIDDQIHGTSQELAIHLITPFHPDADHKELLKASTMGKPELRVVLPQDARLMADLQLYLQTETYTQQQMGKHQPSSIQQILTQKGLQNQERQRGLNERLEAGLGEALLILNGMVLGHEGQGRLVAAFQDLITQTYPHLKMLCNQVYTKEQVQQALSVGQSGVMGDPTEPEQEVFNFIQRENKLGTRVMVKSLREKFERRPYGWQDLAVLLMVAKLAARGKVEAVADGEMLTGEGLAIALLDRYRQGNLVLRPQVEFDRGEVRRLEQFYQDFFNRTLDQKKAQELGQLTKQGFEELVRELAALVAQVEQYPFLEPLVGAIARLKACYPQGWEWYIQVLPPQMEELLDLKEGVIDPLVSFMNGSQRGIYDRARQFVASEGANFEYVGGDGPAQLRELLSDRTCFQKIPRLKGTLEAVEGALAAQVAVEREQGLGRLAAMRDRLSADPDFGRLTTAQQGELLAVFGGLESRLGERSDIAGIREGVNRFEEEGYRQLLAKMAAWLRPVAVERGADWVEPVESVVVSLKQVKVSYGGVSLKTVADVEAYLAAMREGLMAEIDQGRQIQV